MLKVTLWIMGIFALLFALVGFAALRNSGLTADRERKMRGQHGIDPEK